MDMTRGRGRCRILVGNIAHCVSALCVRECGMHCVRSVGCMCEEVWSVSGSGLIILQQSPLLKIKTTLEHSE